MKYYQLTKKTGNFVINACRHAPRHAAISNEEALELYALAREADFDIYELGSFRGRSTIALSLGLYKSNKKSTVYAVDPLGFDKPSGIPKGFEQQKNESIVDFNARIFWHNLQSANVPKNVRLLTERSDEIELGNQKLGLVFSDSDKSLETMKSDFDRYWPNIVRGGYMCFHDFKYVPREGGEKFPATRQFFNDVVYNNMTLEKEIFREVYFVDKMLVLKKF